MAVAAAVVLVASERHSLPLFLAGFIVLFVFAGIGNGSTYKMIPALFKARADAKIYDGESPEVAVAQSRRLSAALIGLAGAIGAFGGVLVNLAFRQSFLSTHNGNAAYIAFLSFYALCFVVTYLAYVRPSARKDPVPASGARNV